MKRAARAFAATFDTELRVRDGGTKTRQNGAMIGRAMHEATLYARYFSSFSQHISPFPRYIT